MGDPVTVKAYDGRIIEPMGNGRGKYRLKDLVARIPKGYKPQKV